MRFLLTLSLIITVLLSYGHEGHQAFYRITEENGALILTVKIEIPDVETCLNSEELCSNSQEMKWCASTWVSNLFSVKLDGVQVEELYESSFTEMGHLVLQFTLTNAPEKFQNVEIENFCFLGSFDSYDNIVQVSLDGFDQGYLMSENRTNIKIDLKNRS